MKYFQLLILMVLLLNACSRDESSTPESDDKYKDLEVEIVEADLTATTLKIVIPNKIDRFKKSGENPDKPLLFSDFEKTDAGTEPAIGDLAVDDFSPWEDKGGQVIRHWYPMLLDLAMSQTNDL